MKYLDFKIETAISFAKLAHAHQLRKDGSEYFFHCYRTMCLLFGCGETNSDILVASLLHDVLEDTYFDKETILNRFGSNVTKLVEELTFNPDHSKEEYFAAMSQDAATIKIADRFDNINCMHNSGWSQDKQRKYAQSSLTMLEVFEQKSYNIGNLGKALRHICVDILDY